MANFQSLGTLPWFIDAWKSIVKIGESSLLSSLSCLDGMLSGPQALFGFKLANSLFMPFSSMFKFPNSSILFRFMEISLSPGFENDEAKCVLRILA